MWTYIYPEELYHHGILGQKWGIRRFQNRDGTYTSAGKRRRNDDLEGTIPNQRSSSGIGKKVATGLAIGAAAGLAAYGLSHLNEDHILAAKDYFAKNMPEWRNKAAASLKEAAKKAGKASAEAALAAVGTMAIAKLTDATSKINTGNANTDQILRESINAGGRAFVNNSSYSNSGNKYKGGPIDRKKGEEISKLVGPPKQKDIDRSSPEYQALFKDRNGSQRDPDTRGMIKSLASAGYGIDQIYTYLDKLDRGEIRHSMFTNYLYHHGIKGQRWGVRRFQNADGSLKAAGKKRYGEDGGATKSSGKKGSSSGAKKEKGSVLKKAGGFLKKAAKVASSVSLDVSNKYGNFKLNDFSDETKDSGRDAVKAWSSSDGIMNVYANNVYINNSNNANSRAEQMRQAKYDQLPDDVKNLKGLGKPANKPVDKDGDEYKELFVDYWGDSRKPETRKLIKDMVDSGYDTKQVKKVLDEIDGDMFSPYNNSYDPDINISGFGKKKDDDD